MFDILPPAGREVVEANNMGPSLDEPIAQMGTDKSGSTGDQDPEAPARRATTGHTGMRHRSLHGCRTFDLAVMVNGEWRNNSSDISCLATSADSCPVPPDRGLPDHASRLERLTRIAFRRELVLQGLVEFHSQRPPQAQSADATLRQAYNVNKLV
ncbi:hypothetical protein LGR54_25340 [Ancylobacter sp. Lp-2]|nr:hypothetical protein [Ancylobacter sp. Lp-2]